MDTLKEFQKMMAEQTDIALATVGADGIPNVRIVNYYFNPENNVIYFATFKNNDKVKEIKQKVKRSKQLADIAKPVASRSSPTLSSNQTDER